MYELLYHLNRDHKITIITVSHDIRASLKYSTHILHLRGGPVYFGKAQEYLSSDAGKMFTGGSANA